MKQIKSKLLLTELLLSFLHVSAQDKKEIFLYPTFVAALFTYKKMSLKEQNPYPFAFVPITRKNIYSEIRYNLNNLFFLKRKKIYCHPSRASPQGKYVVFNQLLRT